MITADTLISLTDAQVTRYAEVIYQRLGVCFSEQKKTLLSNRLRRRLKATGIKSYDDYLDHLLLLDESHEEWCAFFQEVTTHESYLFRDDGHWNWLRQKFIPDLVSQVRAGRPRRLRIWSAACSTGDEPYTLACCVADGIADHASWDIEIVGTDIGIGALEAARMGTFGERAMKKVPESMVRRFFVKDRTAPLWTARPVLKDWMSFKQHNLLNAFGSKLFDLILVKNVLIYFDNDSKRTAMGHIRNALRPGGTLITGPAEGVTDFLGNLERVEGWLHHKPSENTSP